MQYQREQIDELMSKVEQLHNENVGLAKRVRHLESTTNEETP